MPPDADEDYEHVSDIDMSGSEDERQNEFDKSTPATTPQTPRTPRASELKTIPCPYENCPKTFNRNARLQEHVNSHTGTRKHKCPHAPCPKAFLRDSHLKHHLKSAHSDIRDYRCTWEGCDKSFATGTRLRRHEAAHGGREKYRCRGYDGCHETFRKHDTLKKHIALVHEQMRPFPCPETDTKTGGQCTKAFETAEKLRAHQRSKHDDTRFACTECQQQYENAFEFGDPDESEDAVVISFPTYADLQTHIALVHPPMCEYCPTSFSTSKELTRHLELVHNFTENGSSPSNYSCTYPTCTRTFTKKGNLNVHIKTVHEKRRDFVCGQSEVPLLLVSDITTDAKLYGCGRDFTSKSSLEEHIRTSHLGMSSKRLERQKKRKAANDEESEDEPATVKTKKRKPRKDKGTKKASTLQQLTGLPMALARATEALVMLDGQVVAKDEQHQDKQSEGNPSDDEDCMSSSVTMYGSQIYHQDTGMLSADHLPYQHGDLEWEEAGDFEMALDPLLLFT